MKIQRKVVVRMQLDSLDIKVLREKFGKDKMFECIDYIELLKKNE